MNERALHEWASTALVRRGGKLYLRHSRFVVLGTTCILVEDTLHSIS